MHQAEHTHITHRRKFLGGIAALPLLAPGSCPASAEIATDADLLRQCAAYMALASDIAGMDSKTTDTEMMRLCEQQWCLLDAIAVSPAKTLSGIKAKAQIARSYLPDYLKDFEANSENSEIKLIFCLLADIQEIK